MRWNVRRVALVMAIFLACGVNAGRATTGPAAADAE